MNTNIKEKRKNRILILYGETIFGGATLRDIIDDRKSVEKQYLYEAIVFLYNKCLTYENIAYLFGYKQHSSILHILKKIGVRKKREKTPNEKQKVKRKNEMEKWFNDVYLKNTKGEYTFTYIYKLYREGKTKEYLLKKTRENSFRKRGETLPRPSEIKYIKTLYNEHKTPIHKISALGYFYDKKNKNIIDGKYDYLLKNKN